MHATKDLSIRLVDCCTHDNATTLPRPRKVRESRTAPRSHSSILFPAIKYPACVTRSHQVHQRSRPYARYCKEWSPMSRWNCDSGQRNNRSNVYNYRVQFRTSQDESNTNYSMHGTIHSLSTWKFWIVAHIMAASVASVRTPSLSTSRIVKSA